MKYLVSVFAFLFFSYSVFNQLNNPPRQGQEKKVQVGILFDTSNSMDGLINQARSRIWSIINTLSKLEYEGVQPTIEIALYEYGNSTLSSNDKYIRKLNGFTTDLDMISSSLFALTTNGGKEYCGSVISNSLTELEWSEYSEDIRLIYIAGNEMFNQGPDDYIKVLNNAETMDVFVNTIYCGPYQKGVEELWLSGAEAGRGKYLNINSDKKIKHIATPYDDTIRRLNNKLNKTYVSYGNRGEARKEIQLKQDDNAAAMTPSSAVERTVSKSGANYKNKNWDLVDYVGDNEEKITKISKDQLPEEMKDNTPEENIAYLKKKAAERKVIQQRIQHLGEKRAEFLSVKTKEVENQEDDFGRAIVKSIKSFAITKNYKLNN